MTDRSRRHAEFVGSCLESQVPRRRFERAQTVQRKNDPQPLPLDEFNSSSSEIFDVATLSSYEEESRRYRHMRDFDGMLARDPNSAAGLLAAAKSLAPIVQLHRHRFDRDRRLPLEVVGALTELGLTRLFLPQALGGPELLPLDFMEVVEAVAELDGSVGWVVGNVGGMSRAAGYLPEDVARAWFADPAAFVVAVTGATGAAVPAEIGYCITGRWPFASGIRQATRFMGLCAIRPLTGYRQYPDEYLYETLGLYTLPRRRTDRPSAKA
jgi:hypothetical protein